MLANDMKNSTSCYVTHKMYFEIRTKSTTNFSIR